MNNFKFNESEILIRIPLEDGGEFRLVGVIENLQYSQTREYQPICELGSSVVHSYNHTPSILRFSLTGLGIKSITIEQKTEVKEILSRWKRIEEDE